jgi:hypothetical protein
MDINSKDETSYTTQYQKAVLKYVENECCMKHRRLLVTKPEKTPNNNLSCSAMAARSGHTSYDPYDLSSDDDEYLMPYNVAELTPGCSDRTACLMTATKQYMNSPLEFLQNWGQDNPNRNDYRSDPMVIGSIFWLPEVSDWWQQQDETDSKYADLSSVAQDIFSIIPFGIGVEARFCVGR